jgi:hypothetical protein
MDRIKTTPSTYQIQKTLIREMKEKPHSTGYDKKMVANGIPNPDAP